VWEPVPALACPPGWALHGSRSKCAKDTNVLTVLCCIVSVKCVLRSCCCVIGRWQYRFGMQCNIFAGYFQRLSLVPPCLKTGVNFGNSAFFRGTVRPAVQSIIDVLKL
jgi:hypothetical protein